MSDVFDSYLLEQVAYLVAISAGIPLLAGASIGLFISVFQAATSIQEQTLTFVPKFTVVSLVLLLFGPSLFSYLVDFSIEIFSNPLNTTKP